MLLAGWLAAYKVVDITSHAGDGTPPCATCLPPATSTLQVCLACWACIVALLTPKPHGCGAPGLQDMYLFPTSTAARPVISLHRSGAGAGSGQGPAASAAAAAARWGQLWACSSTPVRWQMLQQTSRMVCKACCKQRVISSQAMQLQHCWLISLPLRRPPGAAGGGICCLWRCAGSKGPARGCRCAVRLARCLLGKNPCCWRSSTRIGQRLQADIANAP